MIGKNASPAFITSAKLGKLAWIPMLAGARTLIAPRVMYSFKHFRISRIERPDDSSVEYWTNGIGRIFAYGKEPIQPQNVAENPYVIETELVSPFAHLVPGTAYSFDYEWRSANTRGNYPILDCTSIACISEASRSEQVSNSSVRLLGRFGVFYAAEARVLFLSRSGRPSAKD